MRRLRRWRLRRWRVRLLDLQLPHLPQVSPTRTCQRDRPRWYHSRPIVGKDCRLYLAASAACLARSSPGPSCRIAESAGARTKPHVPTCYTSLVHGSEAAAKHQNLSKLHYSNRPDLPHHPVSAASYTLRVTHGGRGGRIFLTMLSNKNPRLIPAAS